MLMQLLLDANLGFLKFSEIKERIKKTKDEKKAKKAEVMSKSQKAGKGNMPKASAPKGPKLASNIEA